MMFSSWSVLLVLSLRLVGGVTPDFSQQLTGSIIQASNKISLDHSEDINKGKLPTCSLVDLSSSPKAYHECLFM